MGSAAVFFEVLPDKGVLSDVNEDLVVCFREVKRDPFAIMELLDKMPNTRAFFEDARRRRRNELDNVERAALVIYLNKTCFRGLWRVNSRGEFNVPYGDYDRPYYNRDTVLEASKALHAARIEHWSYERALRSARPGDWLYLDPPYVPTGAWGDFTRYTPDKFPAGEHERLADLVRRASDRGVWILLTNSNTAFVRGLYRGFQQWVLPTRRDIDLRAHKRGSSDLIIANYDAAPRERPPGLRRLPARSLPVR